MARDIQQIGPPKIHGPKCLQGGQELSNDLVTIPTSARKKMEMENEKGPAIVGPSKVDKESLRMRSKGIWQCAADAAASGSWRMILLRRRLWGRETELGKGEGE